MGVEKDDSHEQNYIVDIVVNLRVFEDHEGKMNLSLKQVEGDILVVSQFTLYGDCRKGRRPSFSNAAGPEKGTKFYNDFIKKIGERGIHVETGEFGAHMYVESVNHGPVTLLLDSRKPFRR